MKNNFLSKKGFTLIELLIVIALLGALAVAMIAAIDPLEQFNRGQDTGTRNTAEEIYNSAIRYYSLKAEFPWGTTPITTQLATGILTYISDFIAAGEMKTDFTDLAGKRLSQIYVTAQSDKISVCYMPNSKGFQKDSNTKFGSDGELYTAGTCKSISGGTANCFWCFK
jgi:prepilin-type N-terminal cleavage/methylation domain-containing protein